MLTRNLQTLVLGDVPEAHEIFSRPPFRDDRPMSAECVREHDQFREALAQPENYDLVIVGVSPYGLEVLAQVRELRPACPVIMIGEPDEVELLLEAKRKGLEAHLVRTSDPQLFADMLAEEVLTQLRRFIEPPKMSGPSADEMYRYAQFHNVLEPFFVVALRRYLLYVNKAGQELTRTIRGEAAFAGEAVEEWALDSSLESFSDHLDRAFAGHEVVVEQRFAQLDGARGLREIHYQPVTDPNGRVIAVSIAVHQPAQPQLQQSRTMQRVSDFAAGVAHVNNNLLNIIMSNVDLLAHELSGDQNSEAAERIGRIQRGVRRATRFTHQLQAFSRTNVSRCAQIDLNVLIDETQEVLLSVLDPDIDLILDLSLDLPTIYADRSQLEAAFVGLATNANDSMAGAAASEAVASSNDTPFEGKPARAKLVIRTRAVEVRPNVSPDNNAPCAVPEGSYALVEFSDTGDGIPEELHERIFEPFFTTGRTNRHVGLGLAMVRSVVEQCGGAITVESSPGHGATFRCYLPLTDELDLPAEDEEPQDKERASRTQTVAKRPVIMLVEDDEDLREMLAEALRLGGYRTLQAADAEAAVQAYRQQSAQVDLVVTDIILSAGSGTSLAEHLIAEQPDLKIIYISGYGPDVLEQVPELDSMRQIFLSKPVDIETLLETIEELIS